MAISGLAPIVTVTLKDHETIHYYAGKLLTLSRGTEMIPQLALSMSVLDSKEMSSDEFSKFISDPFSGLLRKRDVHAGLPKYAVGDKFLDPSNDRLIISVTGVYTGNDDMYYYLFSYSDWRTGFQERKIYAQATLDGMVKLDPYGDKQ